MNKKLLMFGLPVLVLAVLVSAVIYFHTVSVDITVDEALESTTLDISISAYPGETKTAEIEVNNKADVPLDVELIWVNLPVIVPGTQEPVNYTTDMPKTVTVEPGLNTITAEFYIASDSEVGEIAGEIELNRA